MEIAVVEFITVVYLVYKNVWRIVGLDKYFFYILMSYLFLSGFFLKFFFFNKVID